MNRAAVILVPAALFAAAMWGIVWSIETMVSQENNNRVHAMILGCTYMGKVEKLDEVLVFDCSDDIQLHKEVDWVGLTQ